MQFIALKIRLYPNDHQERLMIKTFGCCRLIFNTALAKRISTWNEKSEQLFASDFIMKLPEMKDKFVWLKEVDSQALQQILRDLDVSYRNFFKRGHGFPAFKRRSGRQSYRSTQNNRFEGEHRIKIGKTGIIRCSGVNGRYKGEKIKNITVSREPDGKYYASVLIERDTTILNHCHEFLACGIDVGVAKPLTIGWENNKGNLVAKHTGLVFTNRLAIKEDRRKRYQRQFARKQKGSAGFKRAKLKVAKAYAAERQYREDWHKKTAHYLCTTFTEIHFEKLKLSNMTRAAQPNAEGIRKGRAAKAGLNRELLRMGFNTLTARVHQKAEQYGTKVVFVDPKHTSQQCSACGHIEKANRKTQSKFKCVSCGFTANADQNASWNILRRPSQHVQ